MARNETLERWQGTTWEEKARENPLYAVMTTDDMECAGPNPTDDELLTRFFAKGVALWTKHVEPLTGPGDYVMEYGCGAGRILRAIHDAAAVASLCRAETALTGSGLSPAVPRAPAPHPYSGPRMPLASSRLIALENCSGVMSLAVGVGVVGMS